jgi:hypothetical protein
MSKDMEKSFSSEDLSEKRRKMILKIIDVAVDKTLNTSERKEKLFDMITKFFFHVESHEGTMRKGLIVWENVWDEVNRGLSNENQKEFIRIIKYMGKSVFDEMNIVDYRSS